MLHNRNLLADLLIIFFVMQKALLNAEAMQKYKAEIGAGKLKVVVYEVSQISSSADSYNALSPHDLASADIVLTTYDTLQKDSHRVRDEHSTSYSLRRPKKYEVRR